MGNVWTYISLRYDSSDVRATFTTRRRGSGKSGPYLATGCSARLAMM